MPEKKGKKLQLIPADQRKCIWVEAGVLSYKLCTSNYNCSSCQFDHAMLEVVRKEEKAYGVVKLEKDRRKKDRRKKEDISWIEEFKRLPAS